MTPEERKKLEDYMGGLGEDKEACMEGHACREMISTARKRIALKKVLDLDKQFVFPVLH